MSSTDVSQANVAAALSTVNVSTANFQSYTVWIALGTLFGIVFVLGSLIIILAMNNTMDGDAFLGLVITNIVFVVIFIFAYLGYLRNIGKYVFSRVRLPAITDPDVPKE